MQKWTIFLFTNLSLTTTIEERTKDKKLQCDINREAVNILALSSRKIDWCEYITGGELLPPDQTRVIGQALI